MFPTPTQAQQALATMRQALDSLQKLHDAAQASDSPLWQIVYKHHMDTYSYTYTYIYIYIMLVYQYVYTLEKGSYIPWRRVVA